MDSSAFLQISFNVIRLSDLLLYILFLPFESDKVLMSEEAFSLAQKMSDYYCKLYEVVTTYGILEVVNYCLSANIFELSQNELWLKNHL